MTPQNITNESEVPFKAQVADQTKIQADAQIETQGDEKKTGLIRKLYNKMLAYAHAPNAVRIYCGIAFAESSFFPLPPDLMMIPMILADRSKAFRLAFLGTICSVIGGFFGYAIGYYLYQSLGIWVIETYGLASAMTKFQNDFAQYGFWIIALKGLTPIPYKLVTIASGVAKFDLLKFGMASVIARAFRFYLLAGVLWYFGPWAKKFVDKYLNLVLFATLGVIVLGFFMVKVLF